MTALLLRYLAAAAIVLGLILIGTSYEKAGQRPWMRTSSAFVVAD